MGINPTQRARISNSLTHNYNVCAFQWFDWLKKCVNRILPAPALRAILTLRWGAYAPRVYMVYRWVCLFVCDKVSVCNLIDCAHALTLIPSYHPHRERVVGVPDALQGAELFVRISDFPTKSVCGRRAE